MLIAYLIGLLPFSVVFVLQRVFYALEDTRTPFFFQTFQSVLLVGGHPVLGHAAERANRPRHRDLDDRRRLRTRRRRRHPASPAHARTRRRARCCGPTSSSSLALVPPAAAGIGLDFALGAFSRGFAVSGAVPAIVSVAAIGAGMAVVYFGVLALLRSPELRELTAPVLRRLRPRR